ncbi:cytosol aminopeptidase-like isoform X3 [Tribolium madens]|uniref:cytosol aminopeptidase-like isoform X3 n=1 Tax=Tribolium madens TaxID=41895 RepID=UPI001CF72281|nr:cytosol aminopeptidase-like isoform X3 [Tribolium madens]
MALSLTCKKLLRLSVTSRYFFRSCSSTCPEKKGLILGVYCDDECEGLELTPATEKYNQKCQGRLLEQIKLTGNKVKAGKTFVFWGLEPDFQSIAVVGLGKKTKPNDELELVSEERESVRIAAAAACRALDAAGVKKIQIESLGDAEAAAEGCNLATWKFQDFKTKKETLPEISLHQINSTECDQWNRGSIKAEAQNIARRLADTPSNHMTPTIFAERALELSKSLGISVEVRDKKWAESEKMGAFLAVAQGSIEPPKFLELSYKNSDSNPFVLVGKGVTFDTGGISLKPPAAMDHMRADMSGAASVVATLYALASLKVPVNIKALIPLTENMPSGSALKPGDVITARNGKTICVDNTDAEGRLILADALSYSANFSPKWVLDIATLTGAMKVALGGSASGVFTNSNNLYKILEEAGSRSGDRVWRMPLWKFFTKQMTDNVAYDVNNVGKGKGGGSCTAAAFLREFVPEKTDWLHVDIAGVMGPDDTTPYLGKGMTGRPTRTLVEFIEAQAKC